MSFIKTIFGAIWRAIFGEPRASSADVAAFFADCSTLTSFAAKLANLGFSWKSDGLNVSKKYDTFLAPDLFIPRKGGNCSDFFRFFIEFAERKNIYDEIKYVLLTGPGNRWHYVSLYRYGSIWWQQSNMNVNIISGPDKVNYEGYGIPEFIKKPW